MSTYAYDRFLESLEPQSLDQRLERTYEPDWLGHATPEERQRGIDLLISMVDEGDTLAADALGAIGPDALRAVGSIRALHDRMDWGGHEMCLVALVKIDPSARHLSMLAEQVRRGDSVSAIEVLCRYDTPIARDALLDVVTTGSWNARTHAFERLSELWGAESGSVTPVDALFTAIGSESAALRDGAVRQVRRIDAALRDGRTLEEVGLAYDHSGEGGVRDRFVAAILDQETPFADEFTRLSGHAREWLIDLCCARLGPQQRDARAAELLARLGAERSVPVLAEVLADEGDGPFADAVRKALSSFRTDSA